MDRREFLSLGAAALAAPLLPAALSACSEGSSDVHPFLPPVAAIPVDDAELEAAVRWMVETPQEGLLERARSELLAGLPGATLDAAIVVANLRRIACFGAGDTHRIFAHEALAEVRAAETPAAGLEWSLWSLHQVQAQVDLHAWGASKYEPPTTLPSVSGAEEAYETAVRRADPHAAEGAAMALYLDRGWTPLLDLFQRMSVSAVHELDHAAIGMAKLESLVARTGEAHTAEACVRYLARSQSYVFEVGPPPADSSSPYISSWATHRAAARAMSVTADSGATDADASLVVKQEVRSGDVSRATAAVRDLWESGVAAASLWDGLVMSAAEHMLVDLSGGPNFRAGIVHALTNVNAMRTLFLSPAASEETRRLMLLQATTFATLFDLVGPAPPPLDSVIASSEAGATLEDWRARLGAAETEFLPDADLPHPDEAAQREVAGAIRAAVQDGLDPFGLVDAHMGHVRRTAKGTHSVKFPLALREELGRVAPKYVERLAPVLGFMMAGTDALDWSAYMEASGVAAEVAA